MVTGCFEWRHGSNVWCDGTHCRCNRHHCSLDNVTCVPEPTTTLNPTDVKYDCDALGVKDAITEPGLRSAISKCIAVTCTIQYWSDPLGHGMQCCSIQCSADTIQAKVPDCWDKIQNAWTSAVKGKCASATTQGFAAREGDVIGNVEIRTVQALASLMVGAACAGFLLVAMKYAQCNRNIQQRPLLGA